MCIINCFLVNYKYTFLSKNERDYNLSSLRFTIFLVDLCRICFQKGRTFLSLHYIPACEISILFFVGFSSTGRWCRNPLMATWALTPCCSKKCTWGAGPPRRAWCPTDHPHLERLAPLTPCLGGIQCRVSVVHVFLEYFTAFFCFSYSFILIDCLYIFFYWDSEAVEGFGGD